MIKKYWYGIVGGVALLLLGGTTSAHAATEFMTSWQARTYVPAWYEGKVFPTHESAITIAFELLDDGKIVDLSKTAVRWYVDGKLIKNEENGLGIKRAVIINKKYGGSVSTIRISIPDYKGKAEEKVIDIPIKTPEVVIDVPYFQNKADRGVSTFYAWPFFFNASSGSGLGLRWTVDGTKLPEKRANESQLLFTIGNDIPSGSRSVIEANIVNSRKTIENIRTKIFVEAL